MNLVQVAQLLNISLVLLEGGGEDDVTRLERGNRVKGNGPPPSASWAKKTIMTDCTQKSGHL